jgi:uncharacterized protein YacL
MLFANISNFYNTADYLPILNGCLNADLIIIFLVYHGAISSYYLQRWYVKFQLSAVIADTLILFIGIIIARFLYRYLFANFSIWKFTVLVVIIQILHDILFYIFFSNLPKGYNYMLDFFKKYAVELGPRAILGDSLMIILATILSSMFAATTLNANVICLVLSMYCVPYLINYKGNLGSP